MDAPSITPVVNIADVKLAERGRGDVFSCRIGRVGPRIGLKGLGCAVTVVPPGKRAFPLHVHHANEEMFVILEGSGEYRIGTASYPVRTGDLLAAPPGGPEAAHQIVNTGDEDLRYLAVSTMLDPDVTEYPESGKFAVKSQMADGSPASARLLFIGRRETTIDYWDGESA